MSKMQVNTEAVVTAAWNLKGLNNQIRNDFSAMQSAISQLDGSWDGSAATSAISKFNEIKSKFYDARYKVVDNYANFLLRQVGEAYTQTEKAHKSLADAFK